MHPIILFFLAYSIRLSWGAGWCYQSEVTCSGTCKGPNDWPLVSQQCSGRAQSPVNIVTGKTLPDASLGPLQFVGYEETFEGRLTNNGHTVQLDLPSSARVKGGKLAVPYKAVQLHFHWGKDGGPGSEHTIDGEQFAMEMHIIHIKEEYKTWSQALADGAGFAVLGFFFQESPTPNEDYDPIISALEELKFNSSSNSTLSSVSLNELVSLEELMPPEWTLTRFYRYQGSLTTPDCNEAVVWTLFEIPILLSGKQLSAFSGLQSASGGSMMKTYRPLQPLNGRQVYYSYYSGGNLALVNTALLISAVLLSSGLSLHTEG